MECQLREWLMLSRISSLRVISHPVKTLNRRNMSMFNDLVRNVLPFEIPHIPIAEASKSGIVSTVTSKAHQKIKERNEAAYGNKKETNEHDNGTTKKIQLNYNKLFLTGLNNIIALLFVNWGIFEITQDKDKILKKTKEFYSKTKETLKSEDEIQQYVAFSNDDDVCGDSYFGCFKDMKNRFSDVSQKTKNVFENRANAPFQDEIFPSTPHMLYRSLCCQSIKLNDFKEAYNDVKKNALDKEGKLHIGLNKVSMAIGFELVCQLTQNNIFGKILLSTNLLPKNMKNNIFKTLGQNIFLSLKKLIVLNGANIAMQNLFDNKDDSNDEIKKPGSD